MLESVQYKHLVQAFERATGLELHAYSLEAVPLTVPFDPPPFCRTLQTGLDCPLYFDAHYHQASAPELRNTCGGLGHVVIPVMNADGKQLLNLVTDTARFGPVDMEAIIEKSFKLKVVPDELANHAEAVPLVSRDRVMFAAQVLFAGLYELAGGEAIRAGALELLMHHVAAVPSDEIPRAVLDAVLEFTKAEVAYISLLDDHSVQVAEASTLKSVDGWWRMLSGVAEWVVHAEQVIEIDDVSESAWLRHLAGSTPPPAAVFGAPVARDGIFGAIVVGGSDVTALAEWRDALSLFVDACAEGLLLCRRLVETGDGAMVDKRTGAYNLRFLEELLEKEISRAGRHNHELSLVVFHLANYPDLLDTLGARGAEELLGQMVELLRSKTRKVNSLARVSETDFALVIPEADRAVAERIADELRTLAQTESFGATEGKPEVRLNLRTRTVSNPSAVDTALENLNSLN